MDEEKAMVYLLFLLFSSLFPIFLSGFGIVVSVLGLRFLVFFPSPLYLRHSHSVFYNFKPRGLFDNEIAVPGSPSPKEEEGHIPPSVDFSFKISIFRF